MVRFKIGYSLDKDLKPEEVNIAEAKEIKIIDLREKLPDLIVKEEKVARAWLTYLNDSSRETAIDQHIKGIKNDFEHFSDVSMKLIRPKEDEYYDEAIEEYVKVMDLKDRLFFDGYIAQVNKTRNNINGKLSALKNLIMEYKL